MTAVLPEKHLILPNGDIHVVKPKRRARRAKAYPAAPRLPKKLQALLGEGWTPAALALAITSPAADPARMALTAAATRVEADTSQNLRRLIQPWQARALTYYDMIGEVWFASQFYSRTLAKVRLFPALLDENGDAEETDDPTLVDLWARVQDPGGSRAELQASYGRLMFLTGEGYLLVSPDPDWGEAWEFLSPDELRVNPGGILVRYRAPQIGTQEYVTAPEGSFEPVQGKGTAPDEVIVSRLWRKHPRYSWLADGPMHATLDVLEELLLLTLAVRSQAKSRAANNGVLLWPDEMSFPQLDASGDEDPNNDPFFEVLNQSFMAPITDPGSAGAGMPLPVRMAADLIAEANGGPRFLKFDQSDPYAEQGMRNELIRRFAMGADLPPEQLLGMTDANHWCADSTTETLTRDRGWITQDELAAGDEILTLNHRSGRSEWKPVLDIYRADVVDEPMVSIESRVHSSLTTLEHNWPVVMKTGRDREWRHSENLNTNHFLTTGAASADIPTESVWSDEMVELAAWLWTEGSITHREGRKNPKVSIYQSHAANPENVAAIRGALEGLYGPGADGAMPSSRRGPLDSTPRWRETQRERGDTVFSLNVAAASSLVAVVPRRIVKREFVEQLTLSQLELFIETSVKADGSEMSEGGMRIVFQKDPCQLDALELACILAGYGIHRYEQTFEGFTQHVSHCLSIHRRTVFGPKPQHKTRTAYTGTIWCPRTGNRTWLARHNGKVYYTGNSGWLIDEQSWKAHLLPVTVQMCQNFNSAYLRPAARDAGYDDWENVTVGFDATEVINHPDRTKDAKDLHDRIVISDEALREAAGFTEDDAPNEDERAERVGIKVRDASLAWYGIPSVKAGGIEPEPGEIEGEQGSATDPAGPDDGADVVKGPPPGGEPEPREPITAASYRILGAAEAAVERCREIAGNRITRRVNNAKCAPCREKIDGQDVSLVASALGLEGLIELGTPSPVELVKGGTRAFTQSAGRLGLTNGYGPELAELIEAHAAATLHDAEPSPLPAEFHVLLQKATANV